MGVATFVCSSGGVVGCGAVGELLPAHHVTSHDVVLVVEHADPSSVPTSNSISPPHLGLAYPRAISAMLATDARASYKTSPASGNARDQPADPHPPAALAVGPAERRPQQTPHRGVSIVSVHLAFVELGHDQRGLGLERPALLLQLLQSVQQQIIVGPRHPIDDICVHTPIMNKGCSQSCARGIVVDRIS